MSCGPDRSSLPACVRGDVHGRNRRCRYQRDGPIRESRVHSEDRVYARGIGRPVLGASLTRGRTVRPRTKTCGAPSAQNSSLARPADQPAQGWNSALATKYKSLPYRACVRARKAHLVIQREVTEAAGDRSAARRSSRLLWKAPEDAIAAYSPVGTLLTWNRGAEAIFGYTAAETIGKHVSMLAERPDGLALFSERVLQGHVVSPV